MRRQRAVLFDRGCTDALQGKLVSAKSFSAETQARISHAVTLAFLFALPGLLCLDPTIVTDNDIWWHLRTGEWILQHHSFPHADRFTSHGQGTPWAAYSWLYELLLLKFFQYWNLAGIVAYTAVLATAIGVALQSLMMRLQKDFIKATLLTTVAIYSLSRLFTPRPWLFTIFFFVLELYILLDARETGRKRGLLWLLPIFALWANIHVQFVDGLVVLGIAAVEPLAKRWWPPRAARLSAGALWLTLCGCLAAILVNPYGVRIFQVAYELAAQKGVFNYVTELKPIPFRSFDDFLILFLPMGAIAVMAWQRRFSFFESALLLFAILTSFRSVRDLWIVVIVSVVILASHLRGQESRAQVRLPALAALFMVPITCSLLWIGTRIVPVNEPRLQSELADNLPVRAVEEVKAKGYAGQLFNDYSWGGFFIWYFAPAGIDRWPRGAAGRQAHRPIGRHLGRRTGLVKRPGSAGCEPRHRSGKSTVVPALAREWSFPIGL